MKPHEFWNCDYREMVLYCEINSKRVNEDFKSNIILEDASTNKMIQSHPLNKRPKIIPLKKMFKELFK